MLLGLLKFLFWFFFISYLIKIFLRLLAPIFMKYLANRMQDKFQQKFNKQPPQSDFPPKNEGDVTIEDVKTSNTSKSDNVGEYVDFEEVDE